MVAEKTEDVVAREAELAAVAGSLNAVADGPRGLLLRGDPGVGKTVLWEQGVAEARERLYWVLTARCVEAEAKLAFTSLGDLLEMVPATVLADLPEVQRHALEVALLRRSAGRAAVDRRAVSAAFLRVLRSLAALAPVVVAIDDLHWLDSPSAKVLAFALRRLEREPVAVLAVTRSSERSPLDLASVLAQVDSLVVPPLGADDLYRLVSVRFPSALSRPTLRRIYATSGGNALIALELARAVVEGEVPEGDVLPLPVRTADVVRARLERLPQATRKALLAASALANPTVARVAAALGRRDGRMPALIRAVDAGVLDIAGESVRFTHPLLASVVYADASPADRRRMHRKLADVVENEEERAKHLALATIGSDEAVAAALEVAARRARDRGATDEAVSLAEQACRLTPSSAERGRRALELTLHLVAAGDGARARTVLDELIESDAPAPLRAEALNVRAMGGIEQEPDRAIALLNRARELAAGDARLLAKIERNLSGWWSLSDLARGEHHARAAVELAEQIGDPGLLAPTLSALARIEFGRGNGVPRQLLTRALALEPGVPQAPQATFSPRLMLGWALASAGDFDAARSLYGEEIQRAADRGDEYALSTLLRFLADVEVAEGAYDAAERLLARARELALQSGQESFGAQAAWRTAWLDALRGRIDDARARAEDSLATARSEGRTGALDHLTVGATSVLGFIELSVGDSAAVVTRLAPLAARMAAAGAAEPSFFEFVPDLIEALVASGDLDEARALLDEQEARTRALDRPLVLATAGRCRGLLEGARGDFDAASRAFAQAARDHERVRTPFDRARTMLVKGTVERRAKQRRAARATLEDALAIFEALGAPLWADKARAELARAGPGARDRRGLTRTEERIARLVAEGRTNREVADALFVSVKTVEANLSRIYGKLGVRSRTELATRMTRASAAHEA